MRKTLVKLFFIQLLIAVLFVVVCSFFLDKIEVWAAAMGGALVLFTTLIMGAIFHILPEVLPSRVFYRSMVVCEAVKWLAVLALGGFLVNLFPPLWVLLGFIATYSAYFWIILFD